MLLASLLIGADVLAQGTRPEGKPKEKEEESVELWVPLSGLTAGSGLERFRGDYRNEANQNWFQSQGLSGPPQSQTLKFDGALRSKSFELNRGVRELTRQPQGLLGKYDLLTLMEGGLGGGLSLSRIQNMDVQFQSDNPDAQSSGPLGNAVVNSLQQGICASSENYVNGFAAVQGVVNLLPVMVSLNQGVMKGCEIGPSLTFGANAQVQTSENPLFTIQKESFQHNRVDPKTGKVLGEASMPWMRDPQGILADASPGTGGVNANLGVQYGAGGFVKFNGDPRKVKLLSVAAGGRTEAFVSPKSISPGVKVGKFFTAEYLSGSSKVKVDYLVLPEAKLFGSDMIPDGLNSRGSEAAEGAQRILTCEYQGPAVGGKRIQVVPMVKVRVSRSRLKEGSLSLEELPSHFFLPAGSRDFNSEFLEVGLMIRFGKR